MVTVSAVIVTARLSAQEAKLLDTLQGHSDIVTSVAFSRDGKLLASGSQDKSAKLWDVASRKLVDTLVAKAPAASSARSVAFSPDGESLAILGNKVIHLWQLKTRKVTATLETSQPGNWSLAFNPKEKTLVTGSFGGWIRLWDLKTQETTLTWQGHRGATAVAFCPDGKALASGAIDKAITIWDAATGKNISTWEKAHPFAVMSVAYSPDGKTLASGGADAGGKGGGGPPDGDIVLWDVATGKRKAVLKGHSHSVFSVAFSPDGKTLASGSKDTTVKLWDIAACKNTATLKGHTAFVKTVAFSPDGKMLASGSSDKTIKLWELPSAK